MSPSESDVIARAKQLLGRIDHIVGWQHHRKGSMRICDGAHDTKEGCYTIAEAEILHRDRQDAEAVAEFIAAAPQLVRDLLAPVAGRQAPAPADQKEESSRALTHAADSNGGATAGPNEPTRAQMESLACSPSAWRMWGDAHDYSRTGKHDPLWCRHCLSLALRALSPLAGKAPTERDERGHHKVPYPVSQRDALIKLATTLRRVLQPEPLATLIGALSAGLPSAREAPSEGFVSLQPDGETQSPQPFAAPADTKEQP